MKKHKTCRCLSVLLVVVALITGSCSKVPNLKSSGPRHSVVVIHSWDSIGEEKALFSECMEAAFREQKMDVEIHHLYANMVRRPDEVFTVFDWIPMAEKIKRCHPEVILLNDDPIVEWVLTHHEDDSIFVNTPVVFAGVTALLRDSLARFPLMTGFEDHIDLGRNIEMMMRIGKTQNITIELDSGMIDNRLRAQFKEELKDSTRFVDNSDFHLKDLSDEHLRKHYPGLAIVNFVSAAYPHMNRGVNESDSIGKKTTGFFYQKARNLWQLQVKRDIYSNSFIDHTGRPQFTCIREQFNNPKELLFLCGYFTGTETQVQDQVRYAVRIMKGEKPKSLPISFHASDYYMDWNALQKVFPNTPYGVYGNTFRMVNAPYYLENPVQFSIEIGLALLLVGTIIYFIVYFLLRWKWKGQMTLVQELQYEEKVHDLMFSNAKDSFWVLSDGVFTFNQQFANYFGLPSNRMNVAEMEATVHADSKVSFDFLKGFREQRGKKTVRLRLSFDGGKNWSWWEAMYTATDESAKTGELYGLLLNIDQKKETEEKLEQAQILASQVALKENFLANISHDLRTPLGAVTGFSTMLTTPGMMFEEGEREQYAEIIHQNTDMILNMIDSVMEKAMIETGDLEIIQKPVSIQKLVNECYKTNYIIAPSHLKFGLEMTEPDAIVDIDMTRTKQVVNNFLSNAFKFTAEGSVTLGWKYMEDDDKKVEVYVRDTGIGVAPEKQAQLFERYVKVNETDRGTGLGLNISKTIIEKQGGTIGVESEMGKGSKFFFRLSRVIQCLLLVFALGMGLLVPSSCSSNNTPNEQKARVLIFHSYEQGYPAYREFNEKILRTFQDQGIDVDIKHVYLDLENPDEDTSVKHLMLRDSLAKLEWKPDVVMTEGDRATHDFIMLKEEGVMSELDSVPAVLAGVHHPEWELIRKHQNLVVIGDPIDYCTNINLAVDMSGRNCVEIELDYFYQDSLIRGELRQAIARPPYIDNSDFHLEVEGDEQFLTIWKDSVMVLVYSTESPERNTPGHLEREAGYQNLKRIFVHSWLYPSLAVKRDIYSSSIVDKTARPQFTAVKADFADGSGKFLCGYFASYTTVGEDMARVASEILKGADLASFVGLTHQKGYYMDYQAMQRIGLEYQDYKDRFTIVGAPIEKTSPLYKYVTWIVIIIVYVVAICAIILVLQSWKSRNAQELIDSVTKRAEIRQMALHGADSHTVRTEANLKEIISHIHPDHSSEIPLIIQSIEIAGTHSYEICADVDGAGDYRWWQLRFVVMYDNKTEEKHVDGILINIDEAKKYEEDLRMAMNLAEEARQKEDFLTTISHEIRTPLNAVVGFSDVIVSMPADSFTPEELAEYAKIIKANNTSLSAMIEDILMFSRIESGRIQYVKEEFDAVSLVDEVAAEWRDLMPENVMLSVPTSRPGITIVNDRIRVKYILNQMMSNAIKFTQQGVVIIGVSYHLNSDKAEFFVGDTGCGLAKEKQPLAFGLFWKDNGFIPGLGLGLHVVKKMTEGMGLSVDVESKVGYGSKFSLYADGFLKKPMSQSVENPEG